MPAALAWEPVLESPTDVTERLTVPGGWLYRTLVYATRTDGEKSQPVSVSVAVTFVPTPTP